MNMKLDIELLKTQSNERVVKQSHEVNLDTCPMQELRLYLLPLWGDRPPGDEVHLAPAAWAESDRGRGRDDQVKVSERFIELSYALFSFMKRFPQFFDPLVLVIIPSPRSPPQSTQDLSDCQVRGPVVWPSFIHAGAGVCEKSRNRFAILSDKSLFDHSTQVFSISR